MTNIQNEALAGQQLNMGGKVYEGDDEGIFAMKPEHAEKLLGTPGWSASKKAPSPRAHGGGLGGLQGKIAATLEAKIAGLERRIDVLEAATPAEALPPLPDSAYPPGSTPLPDPVEPTGGGDDEGPQLEGMTRVQLLETAEKWGVELTAEQKKMKVDDLRDHLDHEIFGDDGNED